MNTLANLPDHSRIWIYTSSREFKADEVMQIKELGTRFVLDWEAHGQGLEARLDVVHNHFIVVAVNENITKASGCSIDRCIAFIKNIEQQFSLTLLDKLNLAYRGVDNRIEVLTMADFQRNIDINNITADTIVFNNMISTLGEFRNAWEVSVENSWQKQLL